MYSIKRSKKKIEVVRKPVIKTDGEEFILAIVDNLNLMGFKVKEV